MPIKQLTLQSEVEKLIDTQLERAKAALIYNLHFIGRKVQNEAVTNANFKDRTKHLRNSFGYVVVVDGVIQEGQFGNNNDPVSEAISESKQFAHNIAQQYPKGIVLIVVAGKNYASHVANKGFNVLQSAELLADQLVPQMLKQLGLKK